MSSWVRGLGGDIIVTDGTAATLAAKQTTRTIPIVMVYVADPIGSGLVNSLARPGLVLECEECGPT